MCLFIMLYLFIYFGSPVLPLSQCGVAGLPAGWVYVVVVDVLLGGRGGRRAAATGLTHLQLLSLLGVCYRSAIGQVSVVSIGGV